MKNLNPKIWKQTKDNKDHLVWTKRHSLKNSNTVVVKKEGGVWSTYFYLLISKGRSLLSRGGTKDFNIFLAKKYMREHQQKNDLRWQ